MEEKIVIDEGIKDTLEILRANPSLFTTKDYFHALPMDYANDPIYAIMQAAVMFDSKMTLTLLFDEFTNKNAKSEFSNKKFKQLYDAALKANQTKGVDENVIRYAPYLAFVYAYAQIVETKEGLTKEENDQLLSEFMQKLKDDSFVSAFYKQEEETEVLDNHHPAYSFVSAFKKFGENVYSDPACYGLFKRKETEAVLNQYLDDAYALYNPNEDKSDFAFFRRFKVTDENASFLKEYDCHDYSDALLIKNKGDLRAAILDAVYKHPIYERSNYNFSYIKTAMSLISDNFEEIVEIYNRKNKTYTYQEKF